MLAECRDGGLGWHEHDCVGRAEQPKVEVPGDTPLALVDPVGTLAAALVPEGVGRATRASGTVVVDDGAGAKLARDVGRDSDCERFEGGAGVASPPAEQGRGFVEWQRRQAGGSCSTAYPGRRATNQLLIEDAGEGGEGTAWITTFGACEGCVV